MSRRVSNNTPDSIQDVKQLENEANARIASAEKQLSDITNEISKAEAKKVTVSDELASLESSKDAKLAEVTAVEQQISEAKDELRRTQGELITARDEVGAGKAALAKAKAEHEVQLAELKTNHQNQMAAYQSTQKASLEEISRQAKVIELKKTEINGLERVISTYKREEQRMETEVLPQIPGKKKELETLNHEILVKQKELMDASVKHKEMVGLYHDEKVKYDEAHALRVSEEQRVEAELKKLADKTDEVESKLRSLRTIQAGVDQATIRLERKEADLDLKEHLFKQREVTQT